MPELTTRAGKGSELTHNELDANFARTVSQKTTNYTCLIGDNRSVIEGSHATTAFTITLPTVATAGGSDTGDYQVTVTNINLAIVTLDGNGAETIDGLTSIRLYQWNSITVGLNSAGTGWKVLSGNYGAQKRIKTADETVNNSTTLQDDDHLINFAVVANVSYHVNMMMAVQAASSTPDLKYYFDVTGVPEIALTGVHNIATAGSFEIALSDGSHGAKSTSIGTGLEVIPLSGIFIPATTEIFNFQWAQNTAHASNTDLKQGSFIELTELA